LKAAAVAGVVRTATDGGGASFPAKERRAVASSVTMLKRALKPSISITSITLLGTRQKAMCPPMPSKVSEYFNSVPRPVELMYFTLLQSRIRFLTPRSTSLSITCWNCWIVDASMEPSTSASVAVVPSGDFTTLTRNSMLAMPIKPRVF